MALHLIALMIYLQLNVEFWGQLDLIFEDTTSSTLTTPTKSQITAKIIANFPHAV